MGTFQRSPCGCQVAGEGHLQDPYHVVHCPGHRPYEHKLGKTVELDGVTFTERELELLARMQRRLPIAPPSSFVTALFDVILRADDGHMSRFQATYPEEARAVIAWQQGDLASRARSLTGAGQRWEGIDI